METSIFTPDLDRLSQLKIQDATEVFGRLLWCEAARLGLVNIVVSGDVNSADGGIDAKAELVGGKGKHSFHYQIKTGTAFKPWQPAAIAKELFGSGAAKPSKAKLGPAVRRCLDLGGTYVLLVLGHDLLAESHSLSVELLQTAFGKCGYKNQRVEVWGSRQVANMMERYPSLCLDLGGLGDARFQTIASWAKNGDMTPQVSLGAAQREFIAHLQTLLTGPDVQHARVVGEPGIGKTRLVLEAIKEMRLLSAKTIYVPHAELFQDSRLFFELLKDDREYSAVLVVDECDEDERASIFRALRGRPRLKLVTIDHGPETAADTLMEIVKFPPLDDPQIEEILRGYIGKAAHTHNWIAWCEGSARVAHAVGENLRRNPGDLLKSPAIVPIWDRFVLGYNTIKGESAERLMTIVRHIALFRKFGARRPVEAEGRFVASLAGRVDPGITLGTFDIAVAKLAGRRILQGSHTLRLVPKALHVYLWKQWWEIHGPSADLAVLMDELPDTLRRWFLDMLIYSNGVSSAQNAIKEVLGAKDGPFTSKQFVASKSGSNFLNVMAEADPAATLAVLERTLGDWPRSDLELISEARQTLVFALEKIAVWEAHFQSAARLLAHLCFGEPATYSNNARGTLEGLFDLRGGPTQASAMDRLAFARRLLSDTDRFNRLLGLDLFKTLLSDQSRSRVIGVEYQGLAPPISFWQPRIWEDLFGPRREAMRVLLESSNPSELEWQNALSKVIIESADDMLRYKPLTELAVSTLREQLNFVEGDGQTLTKTLLNRVKHPYQGTPAEVTKELGDILDAMATGSFAKRFDRFVTYDTYEENYNINAAGEVVESDLPMQRIEALAHEFVGDAEIRRENLEMVIRSSGHRASDFGRRVAVLSFGVIYLDDEIFDHAERMEEDVSINFLSGYLECLKRLDFARWEARTLTLISDAKPRRWEVDSVVYSGFSPKVTERLLTLFSRGAVHASRFLPAGWKLGEEGLSGAEVEAICARLEQSGDPDSARTAVQIASYRFARKQEEMSQTLLWSLLMNPKVFERHHDNMTSYYWKTLAKAFRKRYPERDLELLDGVLTNHCKRGAASFSDVSETIFEISKDHPNGSWPRVAHALEEGEASWSIAHWLGDAMRAEDQSASGARAQLPIDAYDPQQVLAWLAEKPSRADLIVQALPKTLEQGRGGELTRGFIEFFGANSDQARSLMAYFDTGLRWGPDSAFYSRQRDRARTWIDGATTSAREWIGEWLAVLSGLIERARINEERSF